ncbi:MAG TPA: 6-carboxytetrahydropterin synthase QueD [Spirochaetota bacterium]|nr:6-carboxytetrahydropterin synthase QueD [Spirochaetota bacterium]HQO00859.1 6-carboxytetrahydropterin synthase QueD [Spirochaetota bacterium]HQP47695.1 6-carboxytetrahydropterin synthase QueD [Spirochaetota bacterium]
MYILTIEESFAAAHQLRGYKGKCENLHGHNWKVVLSVKGSVLNDIGLLVDFGDLKAMLRETLAELDHHNLNEVTSFMKHNPSSENIARYISDRISEKLSGSQTAPAIIDSVTVWESATSRCTYIPDAGKDKK